MIVTIPAGVKGWFQTKYRGMDVAEFTVDTTVNVNVLYGNEHWAATTAVVPGFPPGHPPILIPVADLRTLEN